MEFHKYHALGNDYLVVESSVLDIEDRSRIVRICDRNRGIGADGILFNTRADAGMFSVRIINPDGSEAEKSGNGLRIYARYLWDQGMTPIDEPFTVSTLGGFVRCEVHEQGRLVTVDMGQCEIVGSGDINVGTSSYNYTAVSIGNPHCVLILDDPTPNLARELGPPIETDARFPNRTNVQLVEILDKHNVKLEIWERGAGYTLASGSSAAAAVSAAYYHGYLGTKVTAHMPGGPLEVVVLDDLHILIKGAVTKVGTVKLDEEVYSA